jgi:hypothetical protein
MMEDRLENRFGCTSNWFACGTAWTNARWPSKRRAGRFPSNTAPDGHLFGGPAITTTSTESEVDTLLTARPFVVVERSTTGADTVDGLETGLTERHCGGVEPTCRTEKSPCQGERRGFESRLPLSVMCQGERRGPSTQRHRTRHAAPARPTPTDRQRPGHKGTSAGAHDHDGARPPPEERGAGREERRGGGLWRGRLSAVWGRPERALRGYPIEGPAGHRSASGNTEQRGGTRQGGRHQPIH